jgi:hypothetical protein
MDPCFSGSAMMACLIAMSLASAASHRSDMYSIFSRLIIFRKVWDTLGAFPHRLLFLLICQTKDPSKSSIVSHSAAPFLDTKDTPNNDEAGGVLFLLQAAVGANRVFFKNPDTNQDRHTDSRFQAIGQRSSHAHDFARSLNTWLAK